jgi:hypothetical protein
MTHPSESHLSPDEIDAWLNGVLSQEWQAHLAGCPVCLDLVRGEREIVDQIAALPLLSPPADFADRVMAAVAVPDPFAIRSLQTTRQRLFATRRSLAVAASMLVLLLGSMAGSIAWTLAHQDTLVTFGGWLLTEAGQLAWLSVRGIASNVIEQPWYHLLRSLVDNPVRLALSSALASLAYLGGVFALRRLLALPTQQVAHAGL